MDNVSLCLDFFPVELKKDILTVVELFSSLLLRFNTEVYY